MRWEESIEGFLGLCQEFLIVIKKLQYAFSRVRHSWFARVDATFFWSLFAACLFVQDPGGYKWGQGLNLNFLPYPVTVGLFAIIIDLPGNFVGRERNQRKEKEERGS